jgi:transformation/transcription domain-associated protein
VLARRFPLEEFKIPTWIRYTKKILVEESHSSTNSNHIFELIVRHSNLFYSWRAEFVPQLVNSLTRLGLAPNNTPENRCLAIELAGLIVAWEKRRQSEAKAASDTGHVQLVNTASSTLAAGGNFIEGAINAKQLSDTSKFLDDLTKRVKTETGLPVLGPMSPSRTSTANIGTPVSAGRHEEFKPTSAMQEVIINFLVKVRIIKTYLAILCTGYY